VAALFPRTLPSSMWLRFNVPKSSYVEPGAVGLVSTWKFVEL